MEVTTVGEEHFRALAGKFRKASNGKVVRAALTKEIRSLMADGVKGVQEAVKGLHVKGVKGGGRGQRLAHYDATHKRAGRIGRHGLRLAVARSTRSRVKYSGNTVGARIYIDVGAMPADQRRLPAALNKPDGWRHPVFGHRDRWVKQVGGPYFEPPLQALTPKVRAGITRAVEKAMKELQA